MPTRSFSSHVRIVDVAVFFRKYNYRSEMKFGGNVVREAWVLDVEITAENAAGKRAKGFGSMPLGNVWAWPPGPGNLVPPAVSLEAMQFLALQIAKALDGIKDLGHPIDLMHDAEPDFARLAESLGTMMGTKVPMPVLAVHVVVSPFTAALLDAFGRLNGTIIFHLLSKDHMPRSLADYVGNEEIPGVDVSSLRDRYLGDYVDKRPKPGVPLYHLVGALDPLTGNDVAAPIGDGRPEHLVGWLNGAEDLDHLKIKLNGDDLEWDVQRVLGVHAVTGMCQRRREFKYSLDFNERARDVQYLLDALDRIEAASGEAFGRIQYVEQPTARDLRALPQNPMHEAARRKPVVIDESLVDVRSLADAIRLGYSGAALKACKGLGNALIAAALATEAKLYLCVQDLTCPGRSFWHSALLAAWIPPVKAIEGNSRQYLPEANTWWQQEEPGLFCVHGGSVATGMLVRPGLGLNL